MLTPRMAATHTDLIRSEPLPIPSTSPHYQRALLKPCHSLAWGEGKGKSLCDRQILQGLDWHQ